MGAREEESTQSGPPPGGPAISRGAVVSLFPPRCLAPLSLLFSYLVPDALVAALHALAAGGAAGLDDEGGGA